MNKKLRNGSPHCTQCSNLRVQIARVFCFRSYRMRPGKQDCNGAMRASPPTSTPYARRTKPLIRAARMRWPSKKRSLASCAGMRWRWWFAPTALMVNWAGISPAMHRRLICLKSVSIISSARALQNSAVISCISSRTQRRAFTHVLFSKGVFPPTVFRTIARKSALNRKACKVSPPTLTLG